MANSVVRIGIQCLLFKLIKQNKKDKNEEPIFWMIVLRQTYKVRRALCFT